VAKLFPSTMYRRQNGLSANAYERKIMFSRMTDEERHARFLTWRATVPFTNQEIAAVLRQHAETPPPYGRGAPRLARHEHFQRYWLRTANSGSNPTSVSLAGRRRRARCVRRRPAQTRDPHTTTTLA
jgi:hypothetical protein